MNAALERNTQALQTLLGDVALASRFAQARLAVVTPSGPASSALALLSEYVVDTLGRLWEQVDFHGGLAAAQHAAARAIASGPTEGLRCAWAPGYDIVVALGCTVPQAAAARVIEVGYDRWIIGPASAMGDTPNPASAAFAAASIGARVFQWVFRDALDGTSAPSEEPVRVDLCALYGLASDPTALALPETVVLGTGAVGHAFLSILERWPHPVSGRVEVVDPDPYGASNMQRYTFMARCSVPQPKVVVRRDALAQRHPGLTVTPHVLDLNRYCQARGYGTHIPLAVVGLDSPEARRQVALKLPVRTVNMWTEGKRVGAGVYMPSATRACLGCDYLEPKKERMDETARVAGQTALRPAEVRQLLDTAAGLTLEQAQRVAAHQHVPVEGLVGEPLRSVLPALCATGHIRSEDGPPLEVPFAFASLFAGISGFMFFLRALEAPEVSEGWTQHLFKAPAPLMRQSREREATCVCCANAHLLQRRRDAAA